MKNLLFYLVTDLHIDDSSGELVIKSIEEVFKDMIANSVTTLVVSGDIFNFRKAQTLVTQGDWGRILELAVKYSVQVIAIPGNHDKMSYTSEDSYLDVFRFHPNFRLIKDTEMIKFGGIDVWFIPFFDEKTVYHQYLEKAVVTNPDSILITHMAVNGVRNNDGTEVSDTLSPNLFKQFKYVYIGHYHDRQFFDNIIYIGSIMQRNFGENELKGYVEILGDGSHEFVNKEFLVYETVKLDYSETITRDLEKLSQYKLNEKLNVRVVLNGTKEELDSLRQLDVMKRLDKGGFVIKSDFVGIDKIELQSAESFTPFTRENLFTEWDLFSKLNSIDTLVGKKILEKLLIQEDV